MMATRNNQPISRREMVQAVGACGAAALGAGLEGRHRGLLALRAARLANQLVNRSH